MTHLQSSAIIIYSVLLGILCGCNQNAPFVQQTTSGNAYYISPAGSDAGDGHKAAPWKTIDKLNKTRLTAGDTVYFEGGQTFAGNVFIDSANATANSPVLITSYGNSRAIINGGNSTAVTLYKCSYVHITNINCTGAGRKTGNIKDGVAINTCNNITLDGLEIKGFQKSGLLIYASNIVEANNVHALENGAAGISIAGDYGKRNCTNIHVINCSAENNPGDPTNLTNHSGNGIIAGECKNVTIEYCTATNNGWDMPRIGNGPVGIWCYEADSVVIQHCISYANKTSVGGGDGGGYDLDGGVTNSIIQYCLSYQNQGSAFGIFQYAGATNWHDNVIRYNISENDGQVSPAHAGAFIWNSSHDTAQFKNLLFYNNVVYNDKYAAISYDKESDHAGFKFYNNIFVGKSQLIMGKMQGDIFAGNDWWSLDGGFNMANGITSFANWIATTHQEQYNGNTVGFNANPLFSTAGKAAITIPAQLTAFNNYQLPAGSNLRTKGLNLKALFGIDNGGKTFNGTTAPEAGIGVSF